MKTLSIRGMRAVLGQLEQLVQAEGELIVTRHGRAIARILPVEACRAISPRSDLRRQLPRLSSSVDLVREERDAR
ncbi:MAG: prevent-host-death protein [Acidobacteria bacterium]|nr:MAG: prevent-host-death protein [Acidobacteriota bacterium]REK08421.1 MAG: prevent-host-death protein [Acidobacteriota bacterium]